ncbi:MAG: hypothetical protein SGBAC_012791 [Bacillariaceae sp.]
MSTFPVRDITDYGCHISFTEESYVDNTPWTLFTHSVSAVVYLMSAKDLNPMIIASNLYGAVGSGLILSLSLAVVEATPEYGPKFMQHVWLFVVLAVSVAPIWAVIYNFEVLEGIDLHMCFSAGYYLALPLSYAARICETIDKSVKHYLFKFFAFVMILIAMSYSHNFYWKCGSYVAYKVCFEDCPLPRGVNQTSLFNAGKLVSLVLWAWAEDRVPSVSFKGLYEPEDDPTVISDGYGSDDDFGMDKDYENSDDVESLEEQYHLFRTTRSSTTEEEPENDSD